MDTLSPDAWRYIDYLNFKYDCLFDQEQIKVLIDVPKATSFHQELTKLQEEKFAVLKSVMPKKPNLKAINRPKKEYKDNGEPTALFVKFEAKRKEHNQHVDVKTFNIIDGYEDGNPNSIPQVKDWLYDMGWEPCTYKYADGKEVPQIRYFKANDPRKGELTASVLRLAEKIPEVAEFAGLSVISATKSRLINNSGAGLLGGVDKDGYVVAGARGLTNTLRFKHRAPIANLTKVGVKYGKEIRSLLIAPEGYVYCGADQDSLEQNTKMHYMFKHDPEYVKTQQVDGFDAHLDLAKFSGKFTQEEIDLHNNTGHLSKERGKWKQTNYSATYGIQPRGLSRDGGFSLKEATEMLDAFWKRNWSLEAIAKEVKTKKTRDGLVWLYNPVSGFWYNLRHDKDKFSTLNQGTGVYAFDLWLMGCKDRGLDVVFQYHDEATFLVKSGDEPRVAVIVQEAQDEANEKLKLNVTLSTTPQFGNNYAEIH